MAGSIGQVYYDVLPNLDGFAAKVASGVGSSAKPLKIKVDADTARASAGIKSLGLATGALDVHSRRLASTQGTLRVAQARLNEVRQRAAAGSSRLISAEESYARASRNVAQAQALAATAAAQGTSKFGGLVKKLDTPAVQSFGRGMAISGAAIAVGMGLAVKTSADFEQAVSHVAATGADAKASISQLRSEAIKYGAATSFSAKEAANAQEELIKANVSVTDTINGGLKGALDLAAAGSLGVADAAGIMATTMSQFKVPGTEASHVADLLAAGAGKAQGEVTDFAGALKYVGPVAKSSNISLEETVGVIAELADQGIKGEMAGTSLRSMIISLTAPIGAGAKAIKKYGLELRDSSGNFIGMEAAAGELQAKLGGLGKAERDAALARIFGKNSITAARILYAGGAKDVAKWTAAVDDSGFASEVAATKMDNLKGDVEKLGGALQSAFIDTASGSTGPLRTIVQAGTGIVDAYSGAPDGVKQTGFAIAGLAASALLGAGGIIKLGSVVGSAKNALDALSISAKTAGIAAGGIGIAIAVAGAVIGHFAIKSAQAAARTDEITSALQRSNGALDDNIAQLRAKSLEESGALQSAQKLGISIGDLTQASLGNTAAQKRVNDQLAAQGEILHAAGGGVDEFGRSTNELEGDLIKVGQAVGSGNKELTNAQAAYKRQKEAVESVTGSAQDLTAQLRLLPKSKQIEVKALIKAGDLAGAKRIIDQFPKKKLTHVNVSVDSRAATKARSQVKYFDGTRRTKVGVNTTGVPRSKKEIAGIKGKPTSVPVRSSGVPKTKADIRSIPQKRGVTAGVKSAGVPGTQRQIKGIKGTSVVARVVASGIGAVQSAINAIHGTVVNIVKNVITRRDGGPVVGLAGGGPIHGPGGPRDDLITGINRATGNASVMVSNKEFITNAQAYADNKAQVEMINAGGKWDLTPRRAGGGSVAKAVGAVAQTTTAAHRPISLTINLDLGPELGGIRRIVVDAIDDNGEYSATLGRMKR